MKCPVCESKNLRKGTVIKTYKIDQSLLYKDIRFISCNDCTHLFNQLTRKELRNLKKYYEQEYYDNIYTPTIRKGLNFTDLRQVNDYDFPAIPDYIDFLEHCWNLQGVIKNIKKYLDTFQVMVPDAGQYNNGYIPVIKEHIQHFYHASIIKLFKKDFDILEEKAGQQEILNGKLKIPTLILTFVKKQNEYPIYYYGASREFLYSWDGIATGIIDETPAKIGKTVNGVKIYSPEIIPTLNEKCIIRIPSLFWKNEIKSKILASGFKGIIE